MREQTGASAHEQSSPCARAEEAVAFLYGEAAPEAAREFQTHLHACAACREELAAFGEVRARVGEWRAEALREVPALGLGRAFAPAAELPPTAGGPRARSARAAVREFFSLAPLWLRAGAFASLLVVCGLAALTVARARVSWDAGGFAFTTGAPEHVADGRETAAPPVTTAPARPDEAEIETIVRRRVEAELAARESERPAAADARDVTASGPAPRLERAASPPRRKRATTPRATPRGRRQLEDEDGLPRLSDLLSGVY